MRRSPRALAPGFVVLGLLCVVAVAATGSTSRGSDRVRPPSTTVLDTLFTLALLGILAGGILVAYGLTQRKAIAREIASGRYPRSSIVGWLVFVGLFTLFAYWRLGLWEYRPGDGPAVDDPVAPRPVPPPEGTPPGSDVSQYEPRLAWIPIVVVVALVVAGVAAYVMAERRARRGVREDDALAAGVEAVLDETLDDLRAEADPRRAIIAAYARLERVLAANGLPRGSSETEEEFLGRLLRSLEISEIAARRLTDLFERAKFSPHAVDVVMKEEAIAALEQLREELRRLRAEREQVASAATATSGALT